MNVMRISLEQEVFPFLAEDPAYQEAVRTERVWRNVAPRLNDELETRVSELVEEKLEKLVEAAMERRYAELVADLGNIHVSLAHIWTVLDENDPADWWKEGHEDGEDEDLVA
jgi:hypothetical protein